MEDNLHFLKTWRHPFAITAITAIYLLFVLKLGPTVMKTRKPFQLKKLLVVYNISQIIFNVYGFLSVLTIKHKLSIFCTQEHTDANEAAVISTLYCRYTALKAYDLFDTVLFVLRKKQKQISFLHVFHHVVILLYSWIAITKFPASNYPAGGVLLFGCLNTFVHACMDAYYLFSTGVVMKTRLILWKKFVTLLQLIQHFVLFSLCSLALISSTCPFSKVWLFQAWLLTLAMVILFVKFYLNAYRGDSKGEKSVNENLTPREDIKGKSD